MRGQAELGCHLAALHPHAQLSRFYPWFYLYVTHVRSVPRRSAFSDWKRKKAGTAGYEAKSFILTTVSLLHWCDSSLIPRLFGNEATVTGDSSLIPRLFGNEATVTGDSSLIPRLFGNEATVTGDSSLIPRLFGNEATVTQALCFGSRGTENLCGDYCTPHALLHRTSISGYAQIFMTEKTPSVPDVQCHGFYNFRTIKSQPH